jgi:hypothetical protein
MSILTSFPTFGAARSHGEVENGRRRAGGDKLGRRDDRSGGIDEETRDDVEATGWRGSAERHGRRQRASMTAKVRGGAAEIVEDG